MKRDKPIVYVVQQVPDGPFKIGISKAPVKHTKKIQEDNPNEIDLKLMINPGTLSAATLAKRACEKLSPFKVRGDWFDGITLATIEETLISKREGFQEKYESNWDTLFSNEEELRNIRNTIKILNTHTNFDYIIDPKRNKIIPKSLKNKKYTPEFIDSDMKGRILKHVGNSNRYDISISKDIDLTLWIIHNTMEHKDLTFKERVFISVYGLSPICRYGKKRHLRTFQEGYSWCHLSASNTCRCKREGEALRLISEKHKEKLYNEFVKKYGKEQADHWLDTGMIGNKK